MDWSEKARAGVWWSIAYIEKRSLDLALFSFPQAGYTGCCSPTACVNILSRWIKKLIELTSWDLQDRKQLFKLPRYWTPSSMFRFPGTGFFPHSCHALTSLPCTSIASNCCLWQPVSSFPGRERRPKNNDVKKKVLERWGRMEIVDAGSEGLQSFA